jgi:hypothetical protein
MNILLYAGFGENKLWSWLVKKLRKIWCSGSSVAEDSASQKNWILEIATILRPGCWKNLGFLLNRSETILLSKEPERYWTPSSFLFKGFRRIILRDQSGQVSISTSRLLLMSSSTSCRAKRHLARIPLHCVQGQLYFITGACLRDLITHLWSCVTLSSILSVSPPLWNYSASTGRIFMKFCYLGIFRISVEKIQVDLKPDKNNGDFTQRRMYICDIILLNSS